MQEKTFNFVVRKIVILKYIINYLLIILFLFFFYFLQYGTNPLIHGYKGIIIIVLIVYGNVAQYQRVIIIILIQLYFDNF